MVIQHYSVSVKYTGFTLGVRDLVYQRLGIVRKAQNSKESARVLKNKDFDIYHVPDFVLQEHR